MGKLIKCTEGEREKSIENLHMSTDNKHIMKLWTTIGVEKIKSELFRLVFETLYS